MKKKNIFLVLFTVVIGFVLLGNVNAKTVDRMSITSMPEPGETSYIFTDEGFNIFNKVAFKAASGSDNITVPTNNSLRKVVVGGLDISSAKVLIEDPTIQSQYFNGYIPGHNALDPESPKYIGYSLDNGGYYPSWSLINTDPGMAQTLLTGLIPEPHETGLLTLGQLALFQTLNNGIFSSELEQYRNQTINSMAVSFTVAAQTNDPTNQPQLTNLTQAGAKFTYIPGNPPTVTGTANDPSTAAYLSSSSQVAKVAGDGAAAEIIKSKLMTGEEVPVTIHSLMIVVGTTPRVIQVSDISSQTEMNIMIQPNSIFFDEYEDNTADPDKPNYNHALWILEHSYPTLSFDDALLMAGVNKTELINEVKGLFGTETPYGDTDADWTKLAEDYVHFITQYAIWKSVDLQFGSAKLGNEVVPASGTGSVTNLDNLYKYYIQDRSEYADYDKKTFTRSKIELIEPNADQKPKESGDYYLYGPYSLKYGFLSSDDVLVTIADTDKTDKYITDKDGNEKSGNIDSGEEFYIKVKKSAKISGVKLSYSTDHAYSIKYEGKRALRGNVYYPHNVLLKDVVAGGVYNNLGNGASDTKDIVFNPKTGVENVAIVFVITLIAFSLGYLVLNYKSKPVELN